MLAMDEKGAHEILNVFTEQGGNFLDSADCYPIYLPDGNEGAQGSEIIIGRWLKLYAKRDDLELY
ncbi:aldo/keto reductase [Photorhabdus viridis]|uniref:aldo/keto reductase n=1 Tax=Photorhabdus viridis TaxID=3163327 RepID=UPI003306CB57